MAEGDRCWEVVGCTGTGVGVTGLVVAMLVCCVEQYLCSKM